MSHSRPQVKAKALILSDEQILCQVKLFKGVRYLSLPGGTQEAGETLEETLLRECDEEIGAAVIINELAFVCPHQKSVSAPTKPGREKLEFVFACEVSDNYVPSNGPSPDAEQIDVCWVDIADLAIQPCLPPQLPEALAGRLAGVSRTYWPDQQAMDEAEMMNHHSAATKPLMQA